MYGLKDVRSRRRDALTRVGWDRLEALLADHYRSHGWAVEHVGTGGSGSRFDGGIDLKLRRPNEYLVVQCKHWNAKQVPHNAVHELLGIMLNECATGAILATSGEFTRYARESAAKGGHIQLIDGDALRAMLGPLPEIEATQGAATRTTSMEVHVGERLLSATQDRIGNGGGVHRKERRAAQHAFKLFLFKCGACLVFAWFVAVVVGGVLNRAISNIGVHGQASTHVVAAPQQTKHVAMFSDASATSSKPAKPCNEIIDTQSGTYIDHCMKSEPHKPPTAAEIRESQRKADEAAAILAPNTPEM